RDWSSDVCSSDLSGRAHVETPLHGHGLDRRLAADAAARRRVEMPLEPLEVDLDAFCKLHADDVDEAARGRLPARRDACDLAAVANDALGEQEADGELRVVSRRTHRDGNAFLGTAAVRPRIAQPDLERLLGGHDVDGVRS